MNYKKVYYQIVENRIQNPLDEAEYGEMHHIIPKSLGGTDEKENIVKLSAREHFICHALLSEMYERESFEWYKMNHAFIIMKSSSFVHDNNRYFNSRLYELKRKDFSKVMSYSQSGSKNSQYGKEKSIKHLNKLNKTIRNSYGGILPSEYKSIQRLKEKSKFTINGKYVNKNRVRKIKEIFGIDLTKNPKKELEKLKDTLYNLYINDRKSTNEIADLFKTNNETIRNYLKYFQIQRRTLSESIKNSNK